jgi:beta-mannosidase
MSSAIDLSSLSWSLTGWRPYAWKLRKSAETGGFLHPDHGPFPARLPGSVQENLRRAGAIPDWHVGRNSLAIEWVEHRHWMFVAKLPPLPAGEIVFRSDGLDHNGWILFDGAVVGEFAGAHLPVVLTWTVPEGADGHELALVFGLPPEGQGQLGLTSLAREAKPRYSFGWDWCVRVVPSGARGALRLERPADLRVERVRTRVSLNDDFTRGEVVAIFAAERTISGDTLESVVEHAGVACAVVGQPLCDGENTVRLSVEHPRLWWPNGEGDPTCHTLRTKVLRRGAVVEEFVHEIGFKHIAWKPCAGAPADALPWLCVVNGRPVFLQGVNWTPPRMCYQDVTREETERLVGIYRDLGCNLLRVWGGGYLESPEFYAACDRAGLLVWQEFPLSSSGVDSRPPEDDAYIAGLAAVARHFIRSRQHHACLLQWCGGNELHVDVEDEGGRRRQPLDLSHRALAALAEIVAAEDPVHRFLPTSPYGPRFHSTREEFGRGLHHEVHGPWGIDAYPDGEWERYWQDDDALFRGETGVAGASRLDLLRRHAGGEALWPPDSDLWRHASGWWTQWDRLGAQFAHQDPEQALPAYLDHTRREQAEKLAFAVRARKAAFPRCAGFLIWMGHDAFPCLANTSIIEFDRELKPAAQAVAAVFRAPLPSG